MSGILYLVATPIGNLGDISQRALTTLREVDFIAAEDTRVTIKLLSRFEIKTPLTSYHEHNKQQSGEQIIGRLQNGQSCALVTDAGSPAISDPGQELVELAAQQGITVTALPGPCAAIVALSLSGMDCRRFCFEGFLPREKKDQQMFLERAKPFEGSLIYYEAPHRIIKTIAAIYAAFGDRPVAITKELTKLHEQVWRGTLSTATEYFALREPQGEYVIIVGGAEPVQAQQISIEQAADIASKLMSEGMPISEAAKQAAKQTGYKKNELYSILINQKD